MIVVYIDDLLNIGDLELDDLVSEALEDVRGLVHGTSAARS